MGEGSRRNTSVPTLSPAAPPEDTRPTVAAGPGVVVPTDAMASSRALTREGEARWSRRLSVFESLMIGEAGGSPA